MNKVHPYQVLRKSFDALESGEIEAWKAIHDASSNSQWAFLSPAFSAAAHRSTGPVTVLLFLDSSLLVAVLPLQRHVGWLGKIGLYAPVGREMADYFGVVARPGVKINLLQALKQGDVPCLYFTHLDESQRVHGLSGSSPQIGLRTKIHPEGGQKHWEELRLKDKKLVSDTERRERKLEKEHGIVKFEMHSSDSASVLNELVRLKNAQYARTGKKGAPLMDRRNESLLQVLRQSEDPQCKGLLSSISVNDVLVAAHFGLQSRSTLHYWFPVYDERYSAYSPGRILFRHILLSCQREGIKTIDRGQGDTPAKRDFANNTHQYLKGLVSNGVRGLLVGGLLRLGWKYASFSATRRAAGGGSGEKA